MAVLPFLLNADLSQDFTVAQVATHGWCRPVLARIKVSEQMDAICLVLCVFFGITSPFVGIIPENGSGHNDKEHANKDKIWGGIVAVACGQKKPPVQGIPNRGRELRNRY